MLTIKQALARYPDLKPAEIAEKTGCAISSVYSARSRGNHPEKWLAQRRRRYARIARENGVTPETKIRWPKEQDDTLRRLWKTHSARQIGELLGRSRNSVIGRAYRLGLPDKTINDGLRKYYKQCRRDMKQIEAINA